MRRVAGLVIGLKQDWPWTASRAADMLGYNGNMARAATMSTRKLVTGTLCPEGRAQ